MSCCDTSSRFSNIQPWSISDFNASFTGVSLKAKTNCTSSNDFDVVTTVGALSNSDLSSFAFAIAADNFPFAEFNSSTLTLFLFFIVVALSFSDFNFSFIWVYFCSDNELMYLL
ncbi:hypothetical protein [Mycoplasmopsis felis]|uniref:hypothetical protein n=1 Tax=Mycoplasmopsis felis TaxID=33923 RepID=UPI001374AE78|nr:hypothetical protein [Mycoplasmopsis felis]